MNFQHRDTHLVLCAHVPTSRPLRSQHPYKRALQIVYKQRVLAVSQAELERFLDDVASLSQLDQDQHRHRDDQQPQLFYQAEDIEEKNAVVPADVAEPDELEAPQRRQSIDTLDFILTLVILVVLVAASHFPWK
ncbi:hypothetical protein VKT23_009136 [Stygiomarasmius scandens]|uniref:Uncharacterized protein n=1 Tax=Marasmiellus scandens TaxID=2682957 RepID=A0ABR1JFC4_9AGAR